MIAALLVAFIEMPYLVGLHVERELPVNTYDIVYEELVNAKSIGITDIILQSVHDGNVFYFPTTNHIIDIASGEMSQQHHEDVLSSVLSNADKLGIGVYIGLGRNGDRMLLGDLHAHKSGWTHHPEIWDRVRNAAQHSRALINEIELKYSKHKSLIGYYISHETGFLEHSSYAFYNKIARHARSKGRASIISPSYIRRNVLAQHCEAIKSIEVDTILYQDRTGDGVYANDGNVVHSYDAQNTIRYLDDYLYSIRICHTTQAPQFGTNIESWRRRNLSIPSTPAQPSEFSRQIELASKYGVVGTYTFNGMMAGPSKNPIKQEQRGIADFRDRASRLYAAVNNNLD